MSVEITRAGLLTTIQDLGRFRFQKYGVIVSGAMDTVALRIANILVGNVEDAAVIEMTLLGPEIKFLNDHLISICGGNLQPTIDNEPLPLWRPVWVKEGSRLRFGKAKDGCRAYLSIQGGFNIEPVLGSRSTYIRARLGGFKGRPLRKGDVLSVNRLAKSSGTVDSQSESFHTVNWSIASDLLVGYDEEPVLRVIRGEEFDYFSSESQQYFLTRSFQVSSNSDRMGYRLNNEEPLKLKRPIELYSGPVCHGTIQVPPDGEPIMLLADRQTTGGYPKIGYVISVDLPRAAQLKPGDKLYFKEVSVETAQRLFLRRELAIKRIKLALC